MEKQKVEALVTRLVTLYRIIIPEVVRVVIFSDVPKSAGTKKAVKLLDSIAESGNLLEAHMFPGSGARFFTAKGATPAAESIEYDLATLWFCFGTDQRRYRVENRELKEVLGEKTPHHHIRHVISDEVDGGPSIFRIYPTTTTVKNTVAHLKKKHIPDAQKKFSDWVRRADYGFAVLVDSDQKKIDIDEELNRKPPGGTPLNTQALIVTASVPTSRNIGDWIST